MFHSAFVILNTGRSVTPQFEEKLANSGYQVKTSLETSGDYTVNSNNYFEIQTADILIVANKATSMTNEMLQQLSYGMLLNKPIILLQPPAYAKDANRFLKTTIESRLSKLVICDLDMLEEDDAYTMLRNAASAPANYVLTKHQQTLIRAELRAYFRNLLG